MCFPSSIRIKLCKTSVTLDTGSIYRIMMDGLVLRIVMHNRGLGNPVMGVLRLASATAIARPTVGAGISTTTGTAVAATGLGLGRTCVPA